MSLQIYPTGYLTTMEIRCTVVITLILSIAMENVLLQK